MQEEIEMLKNVTLESSASSNKVSTASISVEFIEDPQWTGFKFITNKMGEHGPTKEECKEYYSDKYVIFLDQ